MNCLVLFFHNRNEQYQEELWDISIKAIRQYLSPEVLEKYGAARPPTTTSNSSGSVAVEEGSSRLPVAGVETTAPVTVDGERGGGEGEVEEREEGWEGEGGEEEQSMSLEPSTGDADDTEKWPNIIVA